jgi:hypothetical protein
VGGSGGEVEVRSPVSREFVVCILFLFHHTITFGVMVVLRQTLDGAVEVLLLVMSRYSGRYYSGGGGRR